MSNKREQLNLEFFNRVQNLTLPKEQLSYEFMCWCINVKNIGASLLKEYEQIFLIYKPGHTKVFFKEGSGFQEAPKDHELNFLLDLEGVIQKIPEPITPDSMTTFDGFIILHSEDGPFSLEGLAIQIV